MLARCIAGGVLACSLLAQTATEWVRQGRAFKAKGDAASALHAFQQALSLDPKSAEIEDEVGFLLAAMNRRTEAITHFEKAIELDSKWAPAHYHLGVAFWLAEDPERSIPELESAARLRPLSSRRCLQCRRAFRGGPPGTEGGGEVDAREWFDLE